MALEPPISWTTSVLLVDANHTERAFYVAGLKRCSPDYRLLEAANGQTGLDLYRQSQRIDCIVLELALPDMSGFVLVTEFIPIASRPTVAVIVLTRLASKELLQVATDSGVYACLLKDHTTGEDLDKAIQRAVSFVRLMPEEDRHPPL